MICPICKITNPKNQSDDFCVQCGSDLRVHQLLEKVGEELENRNKAANPSQNLDNKKSKLSVILQALSTFLLFGCVIFLCFISVWFLAFLRDTKFQRVSISSQWSKIGLKQLEQMDDMLKEELDIIVDQRRENQALRCQISEMEKPLALVASNFSDKTPKLSRTTSEHAYVPKPTVMLPVRGKMGRTSYKQPSYKTGSIK